MKPLLAHIYEPHRVTYPCYVQPKLNGVRALYQNGHFQSRDEVPFPPGLLDHLARPLRDLFDPSVILDGELYVHGWSLQRILGAVTPIRNEPNEDTLEVEYRIFDVVDFTKSFIERYIEALNKIDNNGPIRTVYTCIAEDEKRANYGYSEFINLGYEGMIYRLGDCPYTVPKQERKFLKPISWDESRMTYASVPNSKTKFLSDKDNRTWHLLKRKDWQDDEFICVDINEGEGKYKGMIGALVCKIKSDLDPRFYKTFSVSSGLTDPQRLQPPSDFIGKQIKVRYLVLSSDGIPLNPSILAIL